MNETLEQFKANQKRNQENLKKLLDFIHTGEKYGIHIEESLKDKIRNAMENVADQKLKVALVGGFSEGKTSIAAAWIDRLDESMKIAHQESSDAVKIYDIDNEMELVDTPGLYGFKAKEHDSGKIERYKDITKKYISEAHLILYALNPSNPIKESHKDDLNWLFRTLNLLSRTIFVISRFDEEADIEDEQDYNKRFKIKKENVQNRLDNLISLSEKEKEGLIIVAVAANPYDLGVEHWLKHQEEFQKLSHIKALQDATQKKIKENGGKLTIIEEAKKSVIQDVIYRQMPPAKQALQDINREMEYLNKTLEKRRKDLQNLNSEISQARINLKEFMNNQNLVIYDLSKYLNEKQYNKVLDYVNQYGATHHEKRKQYHISQSYQQENKIENTPNTENNVKENNAKENNNNSEMNMEQFNKMLEMAQNNPQMLAMLQQTLNKGAEQQKYDHYFANDEVALTQSKDRGR